jgi:HK97 family phage major capsid protein
MDYAKLIKASLDKMETLFNSALTEGRVMNETEQNEYDLNDKKVNDYKKAIEMQNKLYTNKVDLETVVNSSAIPSKITSQRDLSVEKPWNNFGEQLVAVANATRTNEAPDSRLFNAADGMNTKVGADGGFAIHPTFVDSMMGAASAASELYSRVTKIPISGSSNSVSIPAVDERSRADGSRFGGIQMHWASEGSTVDKSKTKLRNVDIKLEKLMGFVQMTEELLQDSAATNAWVQRAFPAELAYQLDEAIFNGSGIGKPLGIRNSAALIEVAKESAQTNGTIVFENVVKMYTRMPKRLRGSAVWFVTEEAEQQLMFMKMEVGTGGVPVYLPAGSVAGTPFATLFGRPVIALEQAAELGYVGDIVFADMTDYVAIEKGGLNVANSMHVEFLTDQEVFRFTKRFNGTPYTNVALASKAKAAFTTSPYVALAARHA